MKVYMLGGGIKRWYIDRKTCDLAFIDTVAWQPF